MKNIAHGNPIFIENGITEVLISVNHFSEKEIQEIVFENPECLPISDIDENYNPIISVCQELNTDAGPLDLFMVTPNGDMAIVEMKLWKNPEARRKVVAQILDYAKELARWTYSDLQRELNKKFGTKGNILYKLSKKCDENLWLSESDFVDSVSRNLRIGKFLLLIAGDGIREGAFNLSEFISKGSNLNYSLAMVELQVFKKKSGAKIIFPRTIVKTVEIQKINIEIGEGIRMTTENDIGTNNSEEGISPDLNMKREFYTKLWSEFLVLLELDDPECSTPKVSKSQNLYLYPGKDRSSWISAYCANSYGIVGVYFRFSKNQKGQYLKKGLEVFKQEIRDELGESITWRWDDTLEDSFSINLSIENIYEIDDMNEIYSFFAEWLNKFVNAIRPKLKKIE